MLIKYIRYWEKLILIERIIELISVCLIFEIMLNCWTDFSISTPSSNEIPKYCHHQRIFISALTVSKMN